MSAVQPRPVAGSRCPPAMYRLERSRLGGVQHLRSSSRQPPTHSPPQPSPAKRSTDRPLSSAYTTDVCIEGYTWQSPVCGVVPAETGCSTPPLPRPIVAPPAMCLMRLHVHTPVPDAVVVQPRCVHDLEAAVVSASPTQHPHHSRRQTAVRPMVPTEVRHAARARDAVAVQAFLKRLFGMSVEVVARRVDIQQEPNLFHPGLPLGTVEW